MTYIASAAMDTSRLTSTRRDLHAHPELAFEEHRTAGVIADYLRGLGIEVVTGIGGTGVIGIIRGNRINPASADLKHVDPVVGLRADMDALPITEDMPREYASTHKGIMHACGHDGHCAMLLGAAELLSSAPNFAGVVVLVFQPAEEGAAGAKAMVADGLLDKFGIQEIYGLHNIPGIPAGHFAVGPGTQLASFDALDIVLHSIGGHAMAPHLTGDVIVAGAALVTELQTVVARRLDPITPAVVSITQFAAGNTNNVLPADAHLRGTVRCLEAAARTEIEKLVRQTCLSVADMYKVDCSIDYIRRYPCTVNEPLCASRSAKVAASMFGDDSVDANFAGILASEDFAFFLNEIPGAYAFIGNGPITETSGPVHNHTYDFNDAIIEPGARYLAAIALQALEDRTLSY